MAPTWDPKTEMPDLRGKVAIVTGANTGIGLSTVKFLALRGARVYLAARNESKVMTAITRLLDENPDIQPPQLEWLPLDLGDPKAVVACVTEMHQREDKLDMLINNAGVGLAKFETNDAGWEMTMAVCHVGHFLLTLGLFPLLERATQQKDADVRVVTLSSIVSALMPPHDLDFGFDSRTFLRDHKTFSTWQSWIFGLLAFRVDLPRYVMAKSANVLFAKELQRRCDAKGIPIISTSIHPGGVATDGAMAIFTPLVKPLIWLSAVPVDEGAVMSLFAATAPVVRSNEARYKGRYLLSPGEFCPEHPVTEDEVQLCGLWDNTLTAVNDYLAEQGLNPVLDV